MKKLLLSTCLAASMLCSAAVPCALAAEPQTVISSEAVTTLFPRTWINHSTAQSVDYEFSSIAGAGKFIQVNYFNSSKVPATVYLYQKSAGNNTEVMQFEIAAGKSASKEYVSQNPDSASDYFIMVECKGSSLVEGYLTVSQMQQVPAQLPFTSEIMPTDALIPEQNVEEYVSGAWDDTVTTVPEEGKFFSIWYQNDNNIGAHVHVYRGTQWDRSEEVINYSVEPGQSVWGQYVYSDENPVTYYIRVGTDSGTVVKGRLAAIQSTTPFIDIPAKAWYKSQAEYVYENGLFSGTSETTFSPELDITRAQIVTVLGNMHQKLTGETIEADTPDFSDVTDGAYYAKYVDWAKENGIVAGFTDGKFHPNDPITREQFAVIINKYIQVNGKTLTASHEYTPFADEDQISSWAKDAVVNMVKYGFMSGKTENQFAPKDSVIRAESATVIADLHKTLV